MFEEDYIMKRIREMVRTILKLLFHMDTDQISEEMLDKEEQKQQTACAAQADIEMSGPINRSAELEIKDLRALIRFDSNTGKREAQYENF